MKETILFLAAPITSSIILAGMLAYFGNHILTRKIIFIDIAVAQIAALGTMIGILLGFAEEAMEVQMISYLFTLIIIGTFAFLKSDALPIPAEAVIGMIYCLGLALALLLAEKIPGGSNYISKTITGNILWVTWDKVVRLGLIFSIIALIHIVLGKKFYALSNQMNKGNLDQNLNGKFLNLLFYITFGVVVVKAVQIGGIFLVFTLLIAPSVAASMFIKNWKGRMFWSWLIGFTGTLVGIIISYWLNISNGPAIVCLLGLLVFILAFVKLSRPLQT